MYAGRTLRGKVGGLTIGEWRRQRHGHSNGGNGELHVNVGTAERYLSMFGGTVIATCGLLRGNFSGLLLAGLGAALIYRGHSRHCDVY